MSALSVDQEDRPEGPPRDLSGKVRSGAAEVSSAAFFTVKPSELHVRSLLGSGAQADVYKAEWTRMFAATTSTILVAVKRLHSDLGAMYRDREALTLLTDHPNLVKCFDSTLDPPYLVVTEFCAGGCLFDLLYNSRQPLSLRQIVKILHDVAAGMKFLHNHKPPILHRDLKSSNVLLTKPIRSADQEPFAKVADFGLARTSEEGTKSTWAAMTVGVGTWRWMAPEVFESEDSGLYDYRIDVFSFAMLMYEMLTRKLPYCDKFPSESADPRIGLHICMGLRPEVAENSNLPAELAELMKQAWASEPTERPDFNYIEAKLRQLLDTIPRPISGDGDGLG
mmetsp:Transcript_56779/g.164723  ORF Transcript_56779/g.164723 Transcript_56779/m.164723 type:complete len:337 (+) Transcript_56779:69-1079(+)